MTKTFQHVTIEIISDEDCQNPRNEFDNLSKFYCLKNPRSITGGELDIEFQYNDALVRYINSLRKEGAFIKEFGSNCYAVIERETVLKEWGVKRISPKIKAIILNNLDCEIQTWQSWCDGECYGFKIIQDSTGEELDSCWGFYGLSDVTEQAEEQAEYFNNQVQDEINLIENRLADACQV